MAREPKRRRRRDQRIQKLVANGHTVTDGGLVLLQNTRGVIKAFGGLSPMAVATGEALGKPLAVQNIWNWQRAGKFPPAYYLIHQRLLHTKGYDAPPELWRILPAE